MKWIRTQEEPLPQFESSVLTIGSFDGVHLGHRQLLQTLVHTAKENNSNSIVCTFRPHPRTVLRPNEPHHRLFDYRDQVDMMNALGVDVLVEEKFSRDFSLMSPEEFLTGYICKNFKPLHIIVGYDFNFGKSRTGNAEFLRNFCDKNKIGLTIVAALEMDGQIVSTSQIRQFLELGDVEKAKNFLGRPYYLRGPVRVGNKRGRTIGTPTANISPEIDFVPRKGVYFTWAYLGELKYPSITNIGFNPTFENSESYLKVETHLFDFDRDIYGDHLKVELVKFHRDEMKFPTIEKLKMQIDYDKLEAIKYFKK
jgi:riboflavin kinase/FMN adenylyltransferase